MAKYDFFLSFAEKDGKKIAEKLESVLTKKGFSVFGPEEQKRRTTFSKDSIKRFDPKGWAAITVQDAIRDCSCFVPIITKSFTTDKFAFSEFLSTLSKAQDRAKKIIPISVLDNADHLHLLGMKDLTFFPAKGTADCEFAAEKLILALNGEEESVLLYEKLLQFRKSGNDNRAAETVCKIIDLKRKLFEAGFMSAKDFYEELLKLYELLSTYAGAYDEDSRKTAHVILDTIMPLVEFMSEDIKKFATPLAENLYLVSITVRLITYDRKIRCECADVLTNGDVRNPCSDAMYVKLQKSFRELFEELYSKVILTGYEKEKFIHDTKDFIIVDKTAETSHKTAEKKTVLLSEEDEILCSVAKFMHEGNKLFDLLKNKESAGEFLRCLLTSYERLLNYCNIINAVEVAGECIERIAEIKTELAGVNEEICEDKRLEDSIKSLLGLTLRGSGKYDVFISFKSEDSDLGSKVYSFLSENLLEAFWSKVSLPQLSRSEYKKAIMNALDKSKHFVLVISDLSYLTADWIETETTLFDTEIKEGRKPDANFIFLVTDSLYDEIMKANKKNLPIEFRSYQILKMSSFRETLLDYVK